MAVAALGGVALRWGPAWLRSASSGETFPGESRLVTIAPSGPIEPIRVAVDPGFTTHVELEYPLVLRDIPKGPRWMWSHGPNLWIRPPSLDTAERAPPGTDPATRFTGHAEAMLRLRDGRNLTLELEYDPDFPDAVLSIEAPRQVMVVPTGAAQVGKSHEAACDTERKQVENLTASNRDLSHALAELVQGHAAPGVLEQLYQSGGVIASGDTGTGAMGEKPIRLKVPDKPFSWQKLPPCNEAAGEEAIGGGCWYRGDQRAPCAPPSAEHDGKCYRAVSKDPAAPKQSEGREPR